MPILADAPADQGPPMGMGLYKRPKDGAVFAIVSPKAGPTVSGAGEIEAVAVDDALGYVYYADESYGIDKWLADPDAPGADRELAVFGKTGYTQDREGIGIYTKPGGTGYIVSVDQLSGESVFHLYKREGEPGRPHDHSAELLVFKGGADGTDGLDVTSAPLGVGVSRRIAGRHEQRVEECPALPMVGHRRSMAVVLPPRKNLIENPGGCP